MKTVNIKIPMGYRFIERHELVDIDRAVEVLETKRQRRYSYALRRPSGTEAELVSHALACPYCGYRQAAYPRFLADGEAELSERVGRESIRKWGTRQISFFDGGDEMLFLNREIMPSGQIICRRCGESATVDSRLRDVVITLDRGILKLSVEVRDFDELFLLPWGSGERLSLGLPVYETVTFNFRRGSVYVSLGDVCGESPKLIRDITESPLLFEESISYSVLISRRAVRRRFDRMFAEAYGGDLPFGKAPEADSYLVLTRFIGYNESFYNGIPYRRGGCDKLDLSFKRMAKILHTEKGARAYLENLDIPKSKAVRRCLFGTQGFMFYLDECEQMWYILNDVNLFCRFLESKNVFEVLACVHWSPALLEFLADFATVRGAPRLLLLLAEDWHAMRRYGISYCSMSEGVKLRERRSWAKNGKINYPYDIGIAFLLPLRLQPDSKIEDCEIDGFSFEWLRTPRDYASAAKALNNCLAEWGLVSNPVVCVKKEKVPVAAIEVENSRVLQAHGRSNCAISEVEGLPEAYEKWKDRYFLFDEDDDEFCFDDDDFLIPF